MHSYLRSIPSSACVLIGFIYIIILSHSCSHFPTHTFTPSHPHRIRVTAYNGIVFGDSSTAVGTTQPIGNHSNQIMQLHAMKLQHACIHYTSSLLPWVDQTFDVYYCNSAMHTHAHTCTPHTHTHTTHTTHTHTQHTHTHTHTHTGPPRPFSTAPTTTNLTSTSVNVSWQSPGGYVDFYNIQYKLSNVEWTSPNDVRNITLMGFQTSVSINRLLPNTTYDLRIRTQNANGQSEWSPVATFTTRRKS